MNINPTDQIAGFPVLEIRRLFRVSENGLLDEHRAADRLKISLSRARKLIRDLHKLGYIEKVKEGSFGYQGWNLTIKGNALKLASAAKPLTRKTADKKLEEFLQRVHEIRSNPNYIFKVKSVHVFGSYLHEKVRLGDIDLAIELQPKEADPDRFQKLRQQRIDAAIRGDRHFSSFLEQIMWPENEVWKKLKSRSRCLSLHRLDKRMMKISKHKLIYEDSE
jgi:predicted nucleotidyltransferase